ncbi:MAG: response regulator transcription factor, partial [Bacteroidota bacterium]
NMEREELIEAIAVVTQGKVYLSKAANEKILEQFQSLSLALDSMPVLTRREKEILQLLSDGLKGPQIAEKLFLSHYTVETHRKNLLKKFNANSLQMLLKIAREYKMLS